MSNYKKTQWWGYLHRNGFSVLQRYFGESDMDSAYLSPLCRVIVGPFVAETRGAAIKKLAQLLALAGVKS